MNLSRFTGLMDELNRQLKEPLPGPEAQLRMVSLPRIRQMMTGMLPGKPKPSSVLLLLYPHHDEVYTVFIRRQQYNGVHSGQISLPGGQREKEDLDAEQTALREAHEEIGIDSGSVRILGKLTNLYIPPSNFMVSPFVGYMNVRPVFVIDPAEVKRTIEVKISELLLESNIREETFIVSNKLTVTAPAYVIGKEKIWGATAAIISEFCEVYRHIGQKQEQF